MFALYSEYIVFDNVVNNSLIEWDIISIIYSHCYLVPLIIYEELLILSDEHGFLIIMKRPIVDMCYNSHNNSLMKILICVITIIHR